MNQALRQLDPPATTDERTLQRTAAHALRGRYRLTEILGRGGMSVVYGAEEVALGREVALKILDPAFAGALPDRERFRREARALAAFDHPGIVPIYAVGDAEGLPFFTMRRIDGRSLAARLEDGSGRMPIPRAMATLAQLADALHAVHGAGIVHRDVKPGNVLLDGVAERPVLIDFGVATVGTSDHSRGEVVRGYGTLEYMCPEQALGEHECDARGDIYSLGVVAFRMLTGRLPFRGAEPREIIAQHVARPAPLVSTFQPDVPPAVDDLIGRCLAKAPGDRWPSAAALAEACRASLAPADAGPHRGFLTRVLARRRNGVVERR